MYRADRQLALLFSLMGELQPIDEIARLVASTDNAYVDAFEVVDGGSGYEVSLATPGFLLAR